MTANVDVFVSAARENASVAHELADALRASGLTCFSGASSQAAAETLNALETGRALVFVLSAAANAAPEVKRELERAAARGIPIITYAIENVPPSAAIAYFTETVPPVAAWTGEDRERAISTLVAATQRGLKETGVSPERSGSARSSYTRATYRDAKGLQIAVAAALIASVCLNAYVLYRDTSFVVSRLLGRQTPGVVTAQDYFGYLSLVSAFGAWVLIAATIVVLRRARLNLLSMFVNVRTSGGEILWRPFVPFANAIWMPRMASELRDPDDSDEQTEIPNWPLARWWGLAFFVTYSLGGFRDGLTNAAPQSLGPIVAVSVVLDILQVVTPFLTYPVLAQVLESVRARRRGRQMPHVPAVSVASEATRPATPLGSNVLVIYVVGDEAVAGNVAGALEESGCHCWTSRAGANQTATASQFACFDAVLVVVSPASHSSDVVTGVVAAALAGPAPVIPFVVEPPPTGSPLGHYIRSLHWIDGATGAAALRSERIRTAFHSTRISATAASGTTTQVDEALFERLAGLAGRGERYREARGLRATAKTLAVVQVVVAAFVGLLAFAIALDPENTDPSSPVGASLVLIAASLPAWSIFVVWLMVTYSNARALQVRELGSRGWLLCQAAVPVISSVLSGRAIGRLWRAIVQADERGAEGMKHFAVVWTGAGLVWIAAAIAGGVLGSQQAIVAAMLASTLQSIATMVRGALRVRAINDVSARLDTRARPWFARELTPGQ